MTARASEDIVPTWAASIPLCDDACPSHDGKRCGVLGCRPDRICAPAIDRVAAEAYVKGWRRGVWDYATHRDGELLVGTLERPIAHVFARGPGDAMKSDLAGEGIRLRSDRG